MLVRVEKPFTDENMSPLPAQKNDIISVTDAYAAKLIKRGLAIDINKLKVETR